MRLVYAAFALSVHAVMPRPPGSAAVRHLFLSVLRVRHRGFCPRPTDRVLCVASCAMTDVWL